MAKLKRKVVRAPKKKTIKNQKKICIDVPNTLCPNGKPNQVQVWKEHTPRELLSIGDVVYLPDGMPITILAFGFSEFYDTDYVEYFSEGYRTALIQAVIKL